MSQTFAKEKPSALYLVDQSEIWRRIPDEKRRERNAVDLYTALTTPFLHYSRIRRRRKNSDGTV